MAARTDGYGFPRGARLLTGRDYRRVFQNAERIADRHFTILVRAGATQGARLGLAIGKRHVPRAHDRNRLKRLCRETFRHWRPELPPVDIVVLARPGARLLPKPALRTKLDKLWERVRDQCSELSRDSSGSTR